MISLQKIFLLLLSFFDQIRLFLIMIVEFYASYFQFYLKGIGYMVLSKRNSNSCLTQDNRQELTISNLLFGFELAISRGNLY